MKQDSDHRSHTHAHTQCHSCYLTLLGCKRCINAMIVTDLLISVSIWLSGYNTHPAATCRHTCTYNHTHAHAHAHTHAHATHTHTHAHTHTHSNTHNNYNIHTCTHTQFERGRERMRVGGDEDLLVCQYKWLPIQCSIIIS